MLARKLAEESMGNILPDRIEEMTIDQVLILVLPKSALSDRHTEKISLSAAVNSGVIPPQPGKSRAQIAREESEKRRKEERHKARKDRRARRG